MTVPPTALPESQPTTLAQWLDHALAQHAKAIDLGLDRVRQVSDALSLRFACPVITVAGTNGKGSTCAMLDAILRAAGYRVGVYTSPHLVNFSERCVVQGQPAADADLATHMAAVESARISAGPGGQPVPLTYFEFTTLAICRLLADSTLDVVVLEVGMGGRLDAVNLFDADCAVITSIDLDHMEFLGPDRESIGREKAGVMRLGKPVIVSDPAPPSSLAEHARAIGADLWQSGLDFAFAGDNQQWQWACDEHRGARKYGALAYPALRGVNQLVNAAGVLAALTALRQQLPVGAQAIRVGLATVELTGRFQMVPGQPALVLDVAHNPHAAAALLANLDAMGFFPRTHAVFGGMGDKDLGAILARLDAVIDHWYLCDLPTPRAASAQSLQALWQSLPHRKEVAASVHASPSDALEAALAAADPADRIVVFGSFFTVGGVVAHGLPKRYAAHLPGSAAAASADGPSHALPRVTSTPLGPAQP